jgi:hypothetical protein
MIKNDVIFRYYTTMAAAATTESKVVGLLILVILTVSATLMKMDVLGINKLVWRLL